MNRPLIIALLTLGFWTPCAALGQTFGEFSGPHHSLYSGHYYLPGFGPVFYGYRHTWMQTSRPDFGRAVAGDPLPEPRPPATVERRMVYRDPLEKAAARIHVSLPVPDAIISINGQRMHQWGYERKYESQPLEPGKTKTFTITAKWQSGLETVERTKTIEARAGFDAAVSFHTAGEPMAVK